MLGHTSFLNQPLPSSFQDGAGIRGKNTSGKDGKDMGGVFLSLPPTLILLPGDQNTGHCLADLLGNGEVGEHGEDRL